MSAIELNIRLTKPPSEWTEEEMEKFREVCKESNRRVCAGLMALSLSQRTCHIGCLGCSYCRDY